MSFDTRTTRLVTASAVLTLAAAVAAFAACGSDEDSLALRRGKGTTKQPSRDGGGGGSSQSSGTPPSSIPRDGGPAGIDGGPDAVPTSIKVIGLVEQCKLITNAHQDDETENHTHSRFNLRGTDLGIPVAHGNDLYFFFGDTAGARSIWPLGPESLPDAIGYSGVGLTETIRTPNALCRNLKFLMANGSDFACGAMSPPQGRNINEFIHNPAGPRGQNAFPTLPGDFEVPSGAFSYNGAIYIYYTIINHDPFEMRGAYLARWNSPSTGSLPNYQILHHVDQRFDDKGPLRGDFINIAPVVHGDYVYIYGSGQYRQSSVMLARKRLSDLQTEGGYERFDTTSKAWVPGNTATPAVISSPAVGELSVVYYPELKKFVMLSQELSFVNARFADAPEGPWTQPIIVASMVDPAFALAYCCVDNQCPGARLFNCDRAGFYGTYLLPGVKKNDDDSFELSFTMSTWDPYNVALMTAKFIDK